MKYKEFKDKINKIGNDYKLNLKVTEDMENIYVKVGDSVCATVSKVMQFFMSMDPGAIYFSIVERQEILEDLYELSKTPIKERQDVKKHLVIEYFDTYPENKFYFDSKEEAEEFLKEKRITNMRYLITYEYRGERGEVEINPYQQTKEIEVEK